MKRPVAVVLMLAFASTCPAVTAQVLTTLASFNGANGDLPYSGLIADPNGNLYGTTFYGGAYGYGTVFELSAATHTITPLVSFNAVNGANPVNDNGRLVVDSSGNLYGTTAGGGPNRAGSVFEVAAGTRALTTLAFFDPATTGYLPYGSLSADASGNLYGTTQFGGSGGGGTVFKVDAATHALTTLVSLTSFDNTNGYGPNSAPVVDAKGNLYGATPGGGPNGRNGTIYEIDFATQSFTTIATFNGSNGAAPNGLIADGKGNLYGTARLGGANGNGAVFEYDTTTHTLTTLASFDGDNGWVPSSSLILDASGNLYGTTYYGGANPSDGTVFELDATSHRIITLLSFDGNNGASPFSTLLADASGNLYGTTTGGDFRAFGLGTVFELSAPEPAPLPILAIAALGILMRRTRGRGRRST